jgi:Lrp/AsnC family leucine-responsive transcriptional regulator
MDFQIEKLLDGIGLKILAALQQHARMPLSRIGEKVGLSAPAVAERVKKLEEAGIIQGYHARIDLETLGRSIFAFISLTTEPRHYPAVKALAADLDQIAACHHVSGGPSFIIQVLVEDLPTLESIIDRLSPFGQTQTSIVLSTTVDKRWTLPLP